MGKIGRRILGAATVVALGYAVYKLTMSVVDAMVEEDELGREEEQHHAKTKPMPKVKSNKEKEGVKKNEGSDKSSPPAKGK